jgi:putative nucleotidyltransferase with HDIG domain
MTTAASLYPFRGSFKRFWQVSIAEPLVAAYALVLAASAAALAIIAAVSGHGAADATVWMLLLLCLVAVAAEQQSVQIGANTQMSVAALPILFAAVAYGPTAAMVVGATSVILDFRRPYARWLIWTASRALAGGLAGLAVIILPFEIRSFPAAVVAVAIAASVEAVTDVFLNALTVAIRRSGSFRETTLAMTRLFGSTIPLYTPVVAGIVYAYSEVSPWAVALFFIPALAAQRLLVLYQEQRSLTEGLRNVNAQLEETNLSFAGALVAALDARDHYTAGHSAAVAVYARDIAAALGLPEKEQRLAHLCGLLHDIGKVGLPPGIVEKEGILTPDERATMQEHSVIGERILSNVAAYEGVARIVRAHHERVDGNGYPDGLPLENIPLLSRIIAVADAYNAMTSGRSYRSAMRSEEARTRLRDAAGTQFDPSVVSAFDALLESASPTYLTAARADFAIEAQKASSRTRIVLGAAA